MAPVDKLDRTIPVEAWVNGQRSSLIVVVHPDQVTVLCGGKFQVEIEAGVWRLLSMHVSTRMAALVGHLRHGRVQ